MLGTGRTIGQEIGRRVAFCAVLGGLIAFCTLLPVGSARRTSAQQAGPFAAVACDRLHTAVRFPLSADAGLVQPQTAQAFDMGRTDIALTCQAVFVAGLDDQPDLALDPGSIDIEVGGPAQIVESGSGSLRIDCGDPSQAGSCAGAVDASQPDGAAVTGTPALTFHLALTPGTMIPPGGLPAAVSVAGTYTSGLDGSQIAAGTSVDIVPPSYSASASASPGTIRSGSLDSSVVTVQFRRLQPSGCGGLAGTPYLVCNASGPATIADTGIEPGTVSFVTTLGRFVNGETRIDALCGDPAQSPAGVVVPPAGQTPSLPQSCQRASVRLSPGGQAGDAVVSVRFGGSVTGAFTVDATHITVAPEPATFLLHGGCTAVRVPASVPAGSPVSLLAEIVDPPSAVLGIWRIDPQTGAWQAGYLRDSAAPVQFDQINPGDTVDLCVDAVARFPLS